MALAEIAGQASKLVGSFLCTHLGASSTGPVLVKPATLKSFQHGEMLAPVEAGNTVRKILAAKGLDESAIFDPAEHATPLPSPLYIKDVALIPTGHLCISLNRQLVFAKCISEVAASGPAFGLPQSSLPSLQPVVVLDHSVQGTVSVEALGLAETRAILSVGLLVRLLKCTGHTVDCISHFLSKQKAPHPDDPGYRAWHLLQSLAVDSLSTVQSSGAALAKEFVSALLVSQFAITTAGETERLGDAHNDLVIDGRGFLQFSDLSGKGGYDKNIQTISVTEATGCLSSIGVSARAVCGAVLAKPQAMLVHLGEQTKSFAIQQAMVVGDIASREMQDGKAPVQHLVLTAGVKCVLEAASANTPTLSELLSVRCAQMMEACTVKYGERAEGSRLQGVAQGMAEAVVKFELLSNAHRAPVKLELPASTGEDFESDVRFDGAFVLYNYARLATLFTHFDQECKKGVYPSLPGVEKVDFSLLKEEEEWDLLFHYILQYPALLEEASKLRPTGIGIQADIGLKKVPQFLTKLSHVFSSYYSRIKILMPPEPHLVPLVHARLYLAAAVKQVMHNSLALLAIEPFEQL